MSVVNVANIDAMLHITQMYAANVDWWYYRVTLWNNTGPLVTWLDLKSLKYNPEKHSFFFLERVFASSDFHLLKFSRALSLCGASIRPVTTLESLLLSVASFALLYSHAHLEALHHWISAARLWTPSPPPLICRLNCYKKQICLTFSFSCQRWAETHSVCSRDQPQPWLGHH